MVLTFLKGRKLTHTHTPQRHRDHNQALCYLISVVDLMRPRISRSDGSLSMSLGNHLAELTEVRRPSVEVGMTVIWAWFSPGLYKKGGRS